MCGIIGLIGSDINHHLIDGLLKMEYRGYDSCGVAYFFNHKILDKKSVTSPTKLEIFEKYKTAIAHTRWATHGNVSLVNAHPIYSSDKRIVIVHNGVLENSEEIKKKYLFDIEFYTETDTEVLVNLINYFYKDDLIEAIKKAKEIIKGSYAFLILDKNNEESIYCATYNMPLILGKGSENICIASDILAFPNDVFKYANISDNYIGVINKESIKKFVFKKMSFLREKESLKKDNYMYDEILEIPFILEDVYHNYFLYNKQIIELKKIINNSKRIAFIASGSSFNALLVAKYLIDKYYEIDSYVYLASEFIYNDCLECDLYFIVSQSGETADVIKAIKKLKDNVITVSLTNIKNSTISRMTKYNFNMLCKRELSVASTKAFISTIFFLYYLICKEPLCHNDIIDSINKVILDKDTIKDFAANFKECNQLFFLGRGIDGIINNENVLKIKEVAYINTNCYFGGELKHGPLALIEKDSNVFVINTNSKTNNIIRANKAEVSTRGGKCYVFSSLETKKENDTYSFSITGDASIFSCAIYFELFAYFLSISKNINPDRPRNLAKSVTVE